MPWRAQRGEVGFTGRLHRNRVLPPGRACAFGRQDLAQHDTYEEIATVVDCSVGNARVRAHRARAKLRVRALA